MKVIILVLAVLYTAQAEKHYHSIPVKYGVSGSGVTTRYWDCCQPSCGWSENLNNPSGTPVTACTADGSTAAPSNAESSCIGGTAYMCSSQQPRMVNSSFALGYVAASFSGGADTSMCCACIRLDFQGDLSGKSMIVQVTNTGGDLGSNHFDIAIPGGGVGIFTEGCSSQWGCPSTGWGDQYGGVSSEAECSQLPSALQSGCAFRFQFLGGVSNPPVNFEQVECPGDLTGATGCTY
uniref:Cellulase n=1 Tax=Oncideres albomarginata chamela TaxID=768145 RepID=D7P695_9CUCU|nr:endo-beta-1,4-glucanase precursor [Oncideres albomarginata chamela]